MKNESAPLISIITVSCNNYAGLKATYESVNSQRRQDLHEWIIVDGGSSDSTVEFMSSLSPSIARWSSERDHGIYDAMNKGIARSRGTFAIFMNAGDEFANADTLERVAERLSSSNDIVFGDAIEVHGSSCMYKAAFPPQRVWYSMFTHHQSIFYRTDLIRSGYDLSYTLAADWVLTSRLIMSGATTYYIAQPICKFHRGGVSEKGSLRDLADSELWRVYREVHQHSAVNAAALYAVKRGANVFRLRAPAVYRYFRSSKLARLLAP